MMFHHFIEMNCSLALVTTNKRWLMHIIHPPHHLELDGRIFNCSRFQHRKLEGLGAIIAKSCFFLLMAVVPKNIFKIPASVDLPSHSWVFTALLPLHPMVLGNGVFAKTTTATVRRRKWLQNGCRGCKNDERHWDVFAGRMTSLATYGSLNVNMGGSMKGTPKWMVYSL